MNFVGARPSGVNLPRVLQEWCIAGDRNLAACVVPGLRLYVCSLANVIHLLPSAIHGSSRWKSLRPLFRFVLFNDRCRISRTFRRLLSFHGCCTFTKTLNTSVLRCSDWFYLFRKVQKAVEVRQFQYGSEEPTLRFSISGTIPSPLGLLLLRRASI